MATKAKRKNKKVWTRSANDPLGRYSNKPKISHVFRITNVLNGRSYFGLETNRNAMWCCDETTYSKSHLQYGSDIKWCPAFKHDLDTLGRHVFVVQTLFSSSEKPLARRYLKNICLSPGFYGPHTYNTPNLLLYKPQEAYPLRTKFQRTHKCFYFHDKYGTLRTWIGVEKDMPEELIEKVILKTQAEVDKKFNRPELEDLRRYNLAKVKKARKAAGLKS